MTASIGGSRSVGINSDDLQKLIKFVGTLDEKDERKSQSAKMNAILEDAINRKADSFSSEDLEQGRRLYEQYQNQFNIDPNNSSLSAEEKNALDLLKKRKEEYDKLVDTYQSKIKMSRTWTEKLAKWAKRQLFRRKSNKFSDIVNSEMSTTTIDVMSISDMLEKIQNICKNSIVNMRTNINDRNALVKSGLLRDVEMVKMYLGKIESLPDEMKQGHENEIADAKNQYSNLKDYYNAFINGKRLPARDLLERYAKEIKKLLDEAKDEENLSKDALLKEMNEYKRLRDKFLTKYVGLNIGEARRKDPEKRKESEKYSEEEFKILDVLDGVRYALTNKKCYYDAWTILNNAFEFDQDRCLATVEDLFDHIDSRGWVEDKSIPEEFTKKHYVELLEQRREELFNLHPEIKRPKKDDSLDKIKQDASVIKNQLSSEISSNAEFTYATQKSALDDLMKKFKNLAGDDQSKYTPEQTELLNLLSDIENSLHNKQMYLDSQSKIYDAFAKYNSDKDAGYDEIKKLAPMLEANAGKYLNASNYSADWCNKTLADIFEKEVAKYPELKQKLENGGPQPTPGTAPTSGGQPEPQPKTSGSKPENVSDLKYKTLYEKQKQQDAEEIARLKQELARKEEELASSKEVNETLTAQLAQKTADSELTVQKKELLEQSIRKNAELATEMRRIGERITDLDYDIRSLENGVFNRYRGEWRYELLNDPNMKDYFQQLEYAPNKEQIIEDVLNNYMQRRAPEKINALKEEKAELEATVSKLEAERQKIMAEEKDMRRVHEQYESAKRQNIAGMDQFGQNLSSVNIQQQEFNNASFTDNMTEEGKRLVDEIFSQGSMQSGFKR